MSEQLDLHAFEDVRSAATDRNAELAANLVRRLAESDCWGEIPVAPAFEQLLTIIPVQDGTRIVDVTPITPREIKIAFETLSVGERPQDQIDTRPTLHGMARAFGLTNARLTNRGSTLTAGGEMTCWALEGLPADVRCETLETSPRLLLPVREIDVCRPSVPERENERATAKLVAALQDIHRAAMQRTDLELRGLDALGVLFPIRYHEILTGLRWIDLDRLANGLAISAPAGEGVGQTLSLHIGGLPVRTAPQHEFEFPLPNDRRLLLTLRISNKRWVRSIGVACYTTRW